MFNTIYNLRIKINRCKCTKKNDTAIIFFYLRTTKPPKSRNPAPRKSFLQTRYRRNYEKNT